MQNPALDIFLGLAIALEKIVNQFANFRADHFRDIFGEQDVKSGIAEVEAHGAERVREGVRFGSQNPGSRRAVAADERGGGAVTKENGRNEIGLGNILTLKGERRKFDSNDENISAGIGL